MIQVTDEMVEAYLDVFHVGWQHQPEGFRDFLEKYVRRVLATAVTLTSPAIAAAEREECARLAEGHAATGVASVAADLSGPEYSSGVRDASKRIARAIRARGETK